MILEHQVAKCQCVEKGVGPICPEDVGNHGDDLGKAIQNLLRQQLQEAGKVLEKGSDWFPWA